MCVPKRSIICAVARDPFVPGPIDWRALKDRSHREGEGPGSNNIGRESDQALEVLLVKALWAFEDEHPQIQRTECEFCKSSKYFVADLIEKEVVHGFRKRREDISSVFTESYDMLAGCTYLLEAMHGTYRSEQPCLQRWSV